MTKVLAIPELLKDILSDLDVKTLLLSQRVCKAFRATITKSTRLQQALFLTPVPTITSGAGFPTINPLLLNMRKGFKIDSYGAYGCFRFVKNHEFLDDEQYDKAKEDMLRVEYNATNWWDGHNSPDRVRGGWEKMLMAQPPGAYKVRLET